MIDQKPVKLAWKASIVALFFISAYGNAQSLLSPFSRFAYPDDPETTFALALGDVNHDGAPDLIVGKGFSQDRLLFNDGHGRFIDVTKNRLPIRLDSITSAIGVGDLDGDGDLDLVLGSAGYFCFGTPKLYLNDGKGNYTDVSSTHMPQVPILPLTECLALVDVDGDSDLDIILGNGLGDSKLFYEALLYLNDGRGHFTDVSSTNMPIAQGGSGVIVVGDLDKDGDPDLVFGRYYRGAQILINDGKGKFADESEKRLSPLPTQLYYRAVALGDVDNDGDLDLAVGGPGQTRLYINDGSGMFTEVTYGRLPIDSDFTFELKFSDLDLDGNLDLFLANRLPGNQGANHKVYRNMGGGIFWDTTSTFIPTTIKEVPYSVLLADVDRDGDSDLVLGNAAQNLVFYNCTRQIYSPTLPQIGSWFTLDLYGPPGGAGIIMMGVKETITPIPPFGSFGLDPVGLVVLPLVQVSGTGCSSTKLAIPNDPWLRFINIFSQGFLVAQNIGLQSGFTNVMLDMIQ